MVVLSYYNNSHLVVQRVLQRQRLERPRAEAPLLQEARGVAGRHVREQLVLRVLHGLQRAVLAACGEAPLDVGDLTEFQSYGGLASAGIWNCGQIGLYASMRWCSVS